MLSVAARARVSSSGVRHKEEHRMSDVAAPIVRFDYLASYISGTLSNIQDKPSISPKDGKAFDEIQRPNEHQIRRDSSIHC